MGEKARKIEETKPEGCEYWPLCVEAQADGVPCTKLGRECDICERAYPSQPPEAKSSDDETLPLSGA